MAFPREVLREREAGHGCISFLGGRGATSDARVAEPEHMARTGPPDPAEALLASIGPKVLEGPDAEGGARRVTC